MKATLIGLFLLSQVYLACDKKCEGFNQLNDDCECVPNVLIEPQTFPQDYCDNMDCELGYVWEFPCQCVPEKKTSIEDLEIIEKPQDYCDKTECEPGYMLEFPCQCVPVTVHPLKKHKCDKLECTGDFEVFDNDECKCVKHYPQDYCGKECPPGTRFEFPCHCAPESSLSMNGRLLGISEESD